MSSIKLKKQVMVKVIVTETFKNQLIQEAIDSIAKIDKDIAGLNLSAPESEKQKEELNKLKSELEIRISDLKNINECE